jgi:hypothetical protein
MTTAISDFFSPLSQTAEDALPHTNQTKKLCDHIGGHFFTLNGAWDGLRIVEYISELSQYIPMTPVRKEFFEHVASVMSKCGNALSMPRIIADIHFMKNSARHIRQVNTLPAEQLERSKIVAHAKKSMVTSSMNLGNDLAQATLFLNDVSILKLGKYAPVAEGIYNVTGLINDTIELVDEAFKLHHYKTAPAKDDNERTTLGEKKTLSWLKIAKDLPSIIGAVLAIAAIFFAALQIPIVAAISLGLTVSWLTMKLASTFYEKITADRQTARRIAV